MSSSKSNFFSRACNRARGKSNVERICKNVFDDLADKDTELLDINSLYIATLIAYNSINKQLAGPHKDPPSAKIVAEKMEEYRAKKGISLTEFQELILRWVEKDLRLVLANRLLRLCGAAAALRTCRKLVVASDTRATIQQLLLQRKITDRAFDRLTEDARKREKEALTFEEVYIAVLCIYNDINKYLPGPHHDPPSKEKLKAMMDEYDVNLDGLLDREEFAEFIRKLTTDSLDSISLKLSGRPTILT